MPQSALELKVWKELAINKQILIKTATDALGLDSECKDNELKAALETGIAQIKNAESNISAARQEGQALIASLEKKLAATEKARKENEAAKIALQTKNDNLEALVEANRKTAAKELDKATSALNDKTKELKSMGAALGDSPANVVKKLKTLNKKKFDEATARKRAEGETRTLKKEKRELKDASDKQEATIEKAATLVEKFRELQTFSEAQYTKLKPLVEEEAELEAVPALDEELLDAIAPPAK